MSKQDSLISMPDRLELNGQVPYKIRTAKETTPDIYGNNFSNTPAESIGFKDKRAKIQLGLEIREKTIKKVKANVLEVTVMWVKNLPALNDKDKMPVVKLSIVPGNTIQRTELKSANEDAQFIEIFEFDIDNTDLTKSELDIQVCDRSATRHSRKFGSVSIPLTEVVPGQPVCKWYYLQVPEEVVHEQKDAMETPTGRKRIRKTAKILLNAGDNILSPINP